MIQSSIFSLIIIVNTRFKQILDFPNSDYIVPIVRKFYLTVNEDLLKLMHPWK